MSRLKPQSDPLLAPINETVVTPLHASTRWPRLELPDAHPTFGMSGKGQDALLKYHDQLEAAMNIRLAEISRAIDRRPDDQRLQDRLTKESEKTQKVYEERIAQLEAKIQKMQER